MAFLTDLHDAEVSDLEPLAGGFWSSAFGYRVGDRELVLRVGEIPEGFEMDRAAMAFRRPGLPIPEVLEIGEGLGCSYAVSVRHYGRFLESVTPQEADVAGPTIVGLFEALRAVPAPPGASSRWWDPDGRGGDSTWRAWLLAGIEDDPAHVVNGWRPKIAADAELNALFETCSARVSELLEVCPERRDLLHGDLLHSNVLLSPDAASVAGVFSWKCSLRGDFLYDVACCTFWSDWYPGIAAADLWSRVLSSAPKSDEAFTDAALRHHCYELRIGTEHLGWNAWRGDADTLAHVAARTHHVLERGPLDSR